MDNGVVTDNVIDTSTSHNMGSKLTDKVPLSNKSLYITLYINVMQPEAIMSNDTINMEHTLVKDSSQNP
jgi:hypothetical protein